MIRGRADTDRLAGLDNVSDYTDNALAARHKLGNEAVDLRLKEVVPLPSVQECWDKLHSSKPLDFTISTFSFLAEMRSLLPLWHLSFAKPAFLRPTAIEPVSRESLDHKVGQYNVIDAIKKLGSFQPGAYAGERGTSLFKGSDLYSRIAKAISGNEGGYTSINWDDAGAGISVGIRQWNQETGELPSLIKAWQKKNPAAFDRVFGNYADKIVKENWLRNTPIVRGSALGNCFEQALKLPEFKQVQDELSLQFVQKQVQLAKRYGIKSELGIATVADMSNQLGEWGCEKALLRSGLVAGGKLTDERKAVERIAYSTNRAGGSARYSKLAQAFSSDKTFL